MWDERGGECGAGERVSVGREREGVSVGREREGECGAGEMVR